MPQLRVYEAKDTLNKPVLEELGFRWCVKDQRWEKNCSDPRRTRNAIYERIPKDTIRIESDILLK